MKFLKTHIIPLLLLWIFINPLIVKYFHLHEIPFHCSAKSEKHFHSFHSKCGICTFHFSNFIGYYKYDRPTVKQKYRELDYPIKTIYNKKSCHHSTLLRAPPIVLIKNQYSV